MAPLESALVRKLGTFIRLTAAELELLTEIQSNRRRIARHTELVHEGQSGHRAFVLQEGWANCYKLLPDGGRQIITFSLPGDCMGLRSVLLRTSDHSFATITDAVVNDIGRAHAAGQQRRRRGARMSFGIVVLLHVCAPFDLPSCRLSATPSQMRNVGRRR